MRAIDSAEMPYEDTSLSAMAGPVWVCEELISSWWRARPVRCMMRSQIGSVTLARRPIRSVVIHTAR